MFDMTVTRTREVHLASAVLIGLPLLAGLGLITTAVADGGLPSPVTVVLTSWLVLAARAIWRSARRPGAVELRAAHAELRQHCRHLAPAEGAYLAIDHATHRRVHLTRRKRMGIATAYHLTVVETDQDCYLDPNTLNNDHFLTAHFFTLNPGLADVRHTTESAAIDNTSGITVLDRPTTTPVWRNFRDAARTQRELLFATLTEVRALTRLLDEATPAAQLD